MSENSSNNKKMNAETEEQSSSEGEDQSSSEGEEQSSSEDEEQESKLDISEIILQDRVSEFRRADSDANANEEPQTIRRGRKRVISYYTSDLYDLPNLESDIGPGLRMNSPSPTPSSGTNFWKATAITSLITLILVIASGVILHIFFVPVCQG